MNIHKFQRISTKFLLIPINIYKYLLISLFFLVISAIFVPHAFAAEFYWYGGTGNWSDYAAHWSGNSGNSPNSPKANAPTSSDNVHFDANSFTGAGQTVTIDVTANCANMDWTGAINTPEIKGAQTINLYGNLVYINAMVGTFNGYLNFKATSGIQTITTNGLTLNGGIQIETAGTTVKLSDDLHYTGNNTSNIYYTAGTFDPNGKAVYWKATGSAAIYGNWTFYDLYLVHSGVGIFNTNGNVGDGFTVTHSLNITGASPNSRLFLKSNYFGTSETINCAGATTNFQDVDFQDITISGSPTVGTNTRVGNAGGNTGITFTAAANKYWVGNGGNWSDATNHWSTSDNGSPNVNNYPLPQDTALFTSNSITSGGQTITMDEPRYGSINFNSVANTPTVSISANLYFFGSVDLSGVGTFTDNGILYWQARTPITFKSNGKIVYGMWIQMPSGTLTLLDDLTSTLNYYFRIDYGTFISNSHTMTNTIFYISTSGNPTMTLGSSQINLSQASTAMSISTACTFTANTAVLTINRNDSTGVSFQGVNTNFNGMSLAIAGTGNYATTINGSNTLNNITVDRSQAPKTVKFVNGTTTTVNNLSIPVSGTTVVTLSNTSGTTPATISKASGFVSTDYLAINYVAATGGATFYAGTHSSNTGGTGWTFADAPCSSAKTLVGKGVDAYQVGIDSSLNICGYVNTSNIVTTPINNTSWHHVSMTYDGTTQKIYVDGVLQSTTGGSGPISVNSSNVEIGQNFAGQISDVRIYNRALSQAEVTASYETYDPGGGIIASTMEKGAVGEWKMNGNAKDSTPNGNDGTVNGATLTTDRKGEANNAYSFNGTNNSITVSPAGNLNLGTDFTISFWANSGGSFGSSWPTVIAKGANQFAVWISPTTRKFTISKDLVADALTSNSSSNAGIWELWTFTRNSSNLWSIYKNGAFDTSTTNAMALSQNTNNVSIGDDTGRSLYFNGAIDDMRIYNRALSSTEISDLYNSYDPGIVFSNLQKGLIGQWKLDGNAKDSTPYGSNGVITGATLTTDRKGQVDKAYSFDGTSAYINAGKGSNFNLTNKLTITAWFYPMGGEATNQYPRIVGNARKDGSGTSGYEMSIAPTPNWSSPTGYKVYFTLMSGDPTWLGTNAQPTFTIPIADFLNHWDNVVLTFDRPNYKMYWNGVLKTSNSWDYDIVERGTVNMLIGASTFNTSVGYYFPGAIDEVRIYNRALSPIEIQALYDSY